MAESISRKQFFRQAFVTGSRFSVDLLIAFQSAAEPRPATTNHAFEADFPPELLASEAARLGLDPDDKAAVMVAISTQMEAARN